MSDDKRDAVCQLHGAKEWVDCWDCGGHNADRPGYTHHDCGEDCCACLDPEDNVRCSTCLGKAGWLRCYGCTPRTAEEEMDV